MSDVSGVSAESTPASEVVVDTPNPITTEADIQPEAKPEPKVEKTEKVEAKPISTREALLKAQATVEKEAKAAEKPEVKTEAKTDKTPEVKTEAKRDETGKFALSAEKAAEAKALAEKAKTETKPSYTAGEAPARFTADAKAAWASLPENVRGEVARMERELTQGYEKHKVAAERDSTLNEFHDMAKQSGKELHGVVREYVNMENHLRKDLVGGLDLVCQKMGVSLRDVAAHVLGQTPDQNASQQDATIRELKAELQGLKSQVGNVTQTFEKQRESATLQEVTAFSQKPEHARFEELSGDIAFFMKSGRATDLSEAYTLAERLNPAPAQASAVPAASSAAPDLSVQTEKGQKSIQGSPTPGSDPVRRAPSTSIKESLKRAMAQAS